MPGLIDSGLSEAVGHGLSVGTQWANLDAAKLDRAARLRELADHMDEEQRYRNLQQDNRTRALDLREQRINDLQSQFDTKQQMGEAQSGAMTDAMFGPEQAGPPASLDMGIGGGGGLSGIADQYDGLHAVGGGGAGAMGGMGGVGAEPQIDRLGFSRLPLHEKQQLLAEKRVKQAKETAEQVWHDKHQRAADDALNAGRIKPQVHEAITHALAANLSHAAVDSMFEKALMPPAGHQPFDANAYGQQLAGMQTTQQMPEGVQGPPQTSPMFSPQVQQQATQIAAMQQRAPNATEAQQILHPPDIEHEVLNIMAQHPTMSPQSARAYVEDRHAKIAGMLPSSVSGTMKPPALSADPQYQAAKALRELFGTEHSGELAVTSPNAAQKAIQDEYKGLVDAERQAVLHHAGIGPSEAQGPPSSLASPQTQQPGGAPTSGGGFLGSLGQMLGIGSSARPSPTPAQRPTAAPNRAAVSTFDTASRPQAPQALTPAHVAAIKQAYAELKDAGYDPATVDKEMVRKRVLELLGSGDNPDQGRGP